MKKVVIPRRDHEVYFIPVPEKLKARAKRSFVAEQMDKLHPGFSGETALDIKHLVLDKTHWFMVTVMEDAALTEYRVLHKGAAFFTSTSIAVKKNGFFQGGIKAIGDELIGYDAERNMPVSIPLESVKSKGNPDADGCFAAACCEDLPKAAKAVPFGCEVFSGRVPRAAAIVVCAALLALIALFFPGARKKAETSNGLFVMEAELLVNEPLVDKPAPRPKYLPVVIEILAGFAGDLAGAGGKMTRWQYNEDAGPLLTIETRAIEAISLREIFGNYEYLVLEDIQDVRYIDGEPYLTVYMNSEKTGYVKRDTGTFFSQSYSLPIISDLTNGLRQHEITIVSEVLPTVENGNALYIMTYTARGLSFVRSLEIITGICDKYPLRVKSMDISIGGEYNLFTVMCSLTQSDTPQNMDVSLMNEKDKVLKAFGYREDPPPPPKAPAEEPQEQQVQEPQPVQSSIQSIVGTIRDDRGQILFYREAGDSKIKIIGTP